MRVEIVEKERSQRTSIQIFIEKEEKGEERVKRSLWSARANEDKAAELLPCLVAGKLITGRQCLVWGQRRRHSSPMTLPRRQRSSGLLGQQLHIRLQGSTGEAAASVAQDQRGRRLVGTLPARKVMVRATSSGEEADAVRRRGSMAAAVRLTGVIGAELKAVRAVCLPIEHKHTLACFKRKAPEGRPRQYGAEAAWRQLSGSLASSTRS
jgi:hypothetical protein